jgi:hypothetical protein
LFQEIEELADLEDHNLAIRSRKTYQSRRNQSYFKSSNQASKASSLKALLLNYELLSERPSVNATVSDRLGYENLLLMKAIEELTGPRQYDSITVRQ